jgi:hypothetical protein
MKMVMTIRDVRDTVKKIHGLGWSEKKSHAKTRLSQNLARKCSVSGSVHFHHSLTRLQCGVAVAANCRRRLMAEKKPSWSFTTALDEFILPADAVPSAVA